MLINVLCTCQMPVMFPKPVISIRIIGVQSNTDKINMRVKPEFSTLLFFSTLRVLGCAKTLALKLKSINSLSLKILNFSLLSYNHSGLSNEVKKFQLTKKKKRKKKRQFASLIVVCKHNKRFTEMANPNPLCYYRSKIQKQPMLVRFRSSS